MTNKFRMMLLSIMAAVGLVGCADKLTDDGPVQGQEGGTEGFVTFKINTVGSQTRATRADDEPEDEPKNDPWISDGFATEDVADEYAITNDAGANVIFLFDQNYKYQERSNLQLLATGTHTDGLDHANDGVNERYFNARIRKAKDGQFWRCVIILNANPDDLKSTNLNLEENVTTLDEFFKKVSTYDAVKNSALGRYGKYFVMSNTVYQKGETAPADTIECATIINDGDIKATAQEAADDPVIVHVERLAAKFELTYGDTKSPIVSQASIIQMMKDGKAVELNVLETSDLTQAIQSRVCGVKILGWDVNAREKSTYFFKNLKYGDGEKAANVYDEKGYIGKWKYDYATENGWNDKSRKRSYWAVDPHYKGNDARYPQQYRQALNVSDEIEVGITEEDALQYITYGNIMKFPTTTTDGGSYQKYRYAPENTFARYDFMTKTSADNDNEYLNEGYMRVGTHLLVAAQLVIADEAVGESKDAETLLGDADITDIYCYENIYWKGDYKEELVKYMLNNVLADYKTTLYIEVDVPNGEGVDGTHKEMVELTKEDANDYFELVDATIKGGDGRVMLQLKSGAEVYRYVEQEGGYQGYEQVPVQDPTLMSVIYSSGTAKRYEEGKMYYAIPIKHMVPTTTQNNVTTIYTGSYGVVRNHWYKVNITNIAKPGTPVDDPGEPIIPNDDPDEGGYIAFEIEIIPWHVIEQDVKFE